MVYPWSQIKAGPRNSPERLAAHVAERYGAPLLLQPDEVRLLWGYSHWDGPLDGIAEVEGTKVRFRAVTGEYAWRRVWGLWRLSDDDIAIHVARHDLWRSTVGSHNDYVYDAQGFRRRAEPFRRQDSAWLEWYKPGFDKPQLPADPEGPPFAYTAQVDPWHRRARSRRWWARHIRVAVDDRLAGQAA